MECWSFGEPIPSFGGPAESFDPFLRNETSRTSRIYSPGFVSLWCSYQWYRRRMELTISRQIIGPRWRQGWTLQYHSSPREWMEHHLTFPRLKRADPWFMWAKAPIFSERCGSMGCVLCIGIWAISNVACSMLSLIHSVQCITRNTVAATACIPCRVHVGLRIAR